MKKAYYLIPIAIALVTPSLIIFCLEVFVGGGSPLAASADIARRQFAPGDNLFFLAALGFIPFAVLLALLKVASTRMPPRRVYALLAGGLAGILALMVTTHVMVWYPMYGPGHMSSTSVIAFLFIPFYCIPTMFVGLAIAWLVSRTSWFQGEPEA
ncbi:MAG: hypothetical protein ACE5EO_04450 [Candidatus Krumholzibacteriia bacterium]